MVSCAMFDSCWVRVANALLTTERASAARWVPRARRRPCAGGKPFPNHNSRQSRRASPSSSPPPVARASLGSSCPTPLRVSPPPRTTSRRLGSLVAAGSRRAWRRQGEAAGRRMRAGECRTAPSLSPRQDASKKDQDLTLVPSGCTSPVSSSCLIQLPFPSNFILVSHVGLVGKRRCAADCSSQGWRW